MATTRIGQRRGRAAGAAWVDLAPLGDAQGLVPAVALALGQKPDAARPLDALLAQLRGRELLLVLDNCEHLLDAVATLADQMLAATAGLKVLATSREALGVPGEQTLAVRPLELPAPGLPAVDLAAIESVQLFVQRAVSAAPDFRLDDAADIVAEICRRVDGIPLALELAAAQLKVVAPAQLLELLEERFRLLVGPRRALARQQTLHAVIQWSHDQLRVEEQRLLGALAVCRGGCDLEAVAALMGPEVTRAMLLSGLARLADLSLLGVSQPGADGGPAARYGLLETVRHFALAQLQARGEAALLRERHLAHYLALAEAHAGEGTASFARVEREHDNLMQALGWVERGDDEAAITLALRLVVALRHYWWARGLLRLGLAATLAAVRRAEAVPSADASRPRPPDRHLVWALIALTQLHRFVDDIPASEPWARRALEVSEALGYVEGRCLTHLLLGQIAAASSRFDEAQAQLQSSLDAAQALAEPRRIADALHAIARLAMQRGQTDAAMRHMEQSLALRRQDGHGFKLALALFKLASIAIDRDQLERARVWLLEAAGEVPRVGSLAMDVELWSQTARLMARRGRHDAAVSLHAAAQARRHAMELPHDGEVQIQMQADLSAARAALGDEAFDATWAAAAALAPAEVMQRLARWLDAQG